MNNFHYRFWYYHQKISSILELIRLEILVSFLKIKLMCTKPYIMLQYYLIKGRYHDYKIEKSLKEESRITGLSIESLKKIHNI